MASINLTLLLCVLLCVFILVSCGNGCLQLREGRNDSVCCQCRIDPPIFLCRRSCQTGFYPTDKADMGCDSLPGDFSFSSDSVAEVSPAIPVSVKTTTNGPGRYTTESRSTSHDGVTNLTTDTSHTTVSGSETDTTGSRPNADNDTTEPTVPSSANTFLKGVTKGSESSSNSSSAGSQSSSEAGTTGSTSRYDTEPNERRSSTVDARPSSYTGTTESRSTFDTGDVTVTCGRCHESCDGCTGPGSNKCIRCAKGFELGSTSSETDPAEDGTGCWKLSEESSDFRAFLYVIFLLPVLLLSVSFIAFTYYCKNKRFKKPEGSGACDKDREGLDVCPEADNKVTSNDPSDVIDNKIQRDNHSSDGKSAVKLNAFSWLKDERSTDLSPSTSGSLYPDVVSRPSVNSTTPDVVSHEVRNVVRDFTEDVRQISPPRANQCHGEKWAYGRHSSPPDGASWKGRTNKQRCHLDTVNELESKDDKNDRILLKLFSGCRKSSIATSTSSGSSRPSSGYISDRGFSSPSPCRDYDSKTPTGDSCNGDGNRGGDVDRDSGYDGPSPDLQKTSSATQTCDGGYDGPSPDLRKTSSATQTCDSPSAPGPLVSNAWQFSKQLSYNGGKVQKQHSDVILEIPKGVIETDEMFAIRGAVSVDLQTAALVLKIPKNEVLVSPVAEFFVAEGHKFKQPVRVVLPILPSTNSDVIAYHFYKDKAGQMQLRKLTRVDPDDALSGQAENTVAGTYRIQGNRVVINIDHFSGVCCTKFECQALCSPPDLWLELFARQLKRSEHNWEVDLQLEIWDNDIKDFRYNRQDRTNLNSSQMVKVDGKRLPALELLDDVGDPSDIIRNINLHMQLVLGEKTAQEWVHLTREGGRYVYSPEEKMDLKRFILCKNHRPDQPERKDWTLTNKDGVKPSDVFGCFVDVAYDTVTVGSGVVRNPKDVTFKISLQPELMTVQTAGATAQRAVGPRTVYASCGNMESPSSTYPQDSLPGSDTQQGATPSRQNSMSINNVETMYLNVSGSDNLSDNAERGEHFVREMSFPERADSLVQISESIQTSSAPDRTPIPVQIESEGSEMQASYEV